MSKIVFPTLHCCKIEGLYSQQIEMKIKGLRYTYIKLLFPFTVKFYWDLTQYQKNNPVQRILNLIYSRQITYYLIKIIKMWGPI